MDPRGTSAAGLSGAKRLVAVGLDGAPGGWVAAACWAEWPGPEPRARRTELLFFPSIVALGIWRARQGSFGEAPVAIDIPIGLPDALNFRPCDREARDRLSGHRKSSVFPAPGRSLLVCATDPDEGQPPKPKAVFERARKKVAEAQELLDRDGGPDAGSKGRLRRITQQTAGILPKIAEVDSFIRDRGPGEPDRSSWLLEVHPELSFIAMNGGAPLPSKSSARGQLLRLDVVRRHFPDAEEQVRTWAESEHQHLIDICDAYAGCWTALRYAATGGAAPARRREADPPVVVLGETAPGASFCEEATGLPMRMVI